ncbi:MAG TPA: ABC transporter substrate-binding protein [Acetobacteraceae bacterium]
MPQMPLVIRSVACFVTIFSLAGMPEAARAYDVIMPSEQPAADPAVLAPVQELNQALITTMRSGKTVAFQSRVDTLAPVVSRVFDLPDILRVSVGPAWASLTADQRSALLSVFRNYTVATYVDNFDSYDGQKFTISPTTRSIGANQQVVDTEIVPRDGMPHRIDYVMRRTGAGWQIVDVLADGSISRVAVQRSDFASLLSRGGASALETSLQQKTQNLSRG